MNDKPDKTIAETQGGEFHTDMPVGEILRRSREHYGQSLEQVEQNLRIRASQLYALENGQVDQLPGKAYALGFVRSYAEYLGLDGNKMVQLYKRQSLGSKIAPDLHFPIPASESKLPPWPVTLVLVIIGIVFVGVWAFYNKEDRSVVETVPSVAEVMGTGDFVGPELPENWQQIKERRLAAAAAIPENADNPENTQNNENAISQTTTAENATPENTQTPDTAPVNNAQEDGIVLNIVENSWVEIRDANNRAIVSRVLKEGEQYFVPDRPDLRMNLGNASGVQIVIDGKALPVLGRRGEVRRNISLDSKSLKALAQN